MELNTLTLYSTRNSKPLSFPMTGFYTSKAFNPYLMHVNFCKISNSLSRMPHSFPSLNTHILSHKYKILATNRKNWLFSSQVRRRLNGSLTARQNCVRWNGERNYRLQLLLWLISLRAKYKNLKTTWNSSKAKAWCSSKPSSRKSTACSAIPLCKTPMSSTTTMRTRVLISTNCPSKHSSSSSLTLAT